MEHGKSLFTMDEPAIKAFKKNQSNQRAHERSKKRSTASTVTSTASTTTSASSAATSTTTTESKDNSKDEVLFHKVLMNRMDICMDNALMRTVHRLDRYVESYINDRQKHYDPKKFTPNKFIALGCESEMQSRSIEDVEGINMDSLDSMIRIAYGAVEDELNHTTLPKYGVGHGPHVPIIQNYLFRYMPRLYTVVVNHLKNQGHDIDTFTVPCTKHGLPIRLKDLRDMDSTQHPCTLNNEQLYMVVSNQFSSHFALPVTNLHPDVCLIIKDYLFKPEKKKKKLDDEDNDDVTKSDSKLEVHDNKVSDDDTSIHKMFYPLARLSSFGIQRWCRPSDMKLIKQKKLDLQERKDLEALSKRIDNEEKAPKYSWRMYQQPTDDTNLVFNSIEFDDVNNIVDCSKLLKNFFEILQYGPKKPESTTTSSTASTSTSTTSETKRTTNDSSTSSTTTVETTPTKPIPKLHESLHRSYTVDNMDDVWTTIKNGHLHSYEGWTFLGSSGSQILVNWLDYKIESIKTRLESSIYTEHYLRNEITILSEIAEFLSIVAELHLLILVFDVASHIQYRLSHTI